MRLIIDFESRSRVDLRKRGAYVYAADPSTEIMCCAFKADNGPTCLWFPKGTTLAMEDALGASRVLCADALAELVGDADELGAHNAQFERLMWREIMVKRHGFPPQPTHRWRCSAARAAALALPRHLDGVGAALNLPIQKDKEGHKLMLRMCKPTKTGDWIEDAASIVRLAQYCVQDVETEHAVEQALPPLPESEERIWQLDQEINDRGVAIDIEGCKILNAEVAQAKIAFNAEIAELTNGAVTTPGQRDKIIDWLEGEGVEMEDMTKTSVTGVLEVLADMPESAAKRLLEIRQTGSLTSVAKLKAMVTLASADGRVRGSLLYYAATTGRWGGKGIQGQNLPRDSYKTEAEVEAVLLGAFEGCAIKAASRCIRGMIIANEGKQLIASDYGAVEARVLAWLAGENHVLDAFRAGLDTYKVAAAAIYGVAYENVTKDQRQTGKTAELACGYQGWQGAWAKMAETTGCTIGDEEEVKTIILAWRANRPATKNLWGGLEEAAVQTVITGKVHKYGKIMFGIKGPYLFMRLPSGRMLAYPFPETEKRDRYGKEVDVVTFMTTNSYTKKWERQSTYGGKLTENAVQAIARDLLCDAIINFDMLGLPVVLHVHDEIVIETAEDFLHSAENIMQQMPAWAEGLPMAAEGWRAFRYRK